MIIFLNHRILFTNIYCKTISSLYTLIFALFGKTETMSDELQKMKTMSDAGANYGLDLGTSTIAPPQKDCFVIPVPCPLLSRYFNTQIFVQICKWSKMRLLVCKCLIFINTLS